MSDYDRGKYSSKKKIYSSRDSSNYGRNYFGGKHESSFKLAKDLNADSVPKKQPTILLKAREPATDDLSASPKRNQKDETATNISATASGKESEAHPGPILKHMTKSHKFIDDGIICTEALHDYVKENDYFLVIGIVGPQGVGKSTIMNLLAHNEITPELKNCIFKLNKRVGEDYDEERIKILTEHFEKTSLKNDENIQHEVFKIESVDDMENGCNRTQGIDIFITSNRLILLDCQPFGCISVLEDLIKSESKRTNLVSEFIPLENSGEIQSLQLTAFLISVCHIFLVVEDWFFDSNVIRFLRTAEMLKPTIHNPEDELIDEYPYGIVVLNKAHIEDFNPSRIHEMVLAYEQLFKSSKLIQESRMGYTKVPELLNTEFKSHNQVPLFLIPEITDDDQIYRGYPSLEELMKCFTYELLSKRRRAFTHVQLSEKSWLLYCAKVWDTVKKSSFFVEYTKLMP